MIVTEEELEEISQAPQYVPPPTSVSEIDFSNQLLHIYPNPTSELVKINYTGAQTPDQIRIYDAMGTQVLTTGYSNTVQLKNLSNGTYFMYLFSENQNIAQQTLVILK